MRPWGAHYWFLPPALSLLTGPCLLSPLTCWAGCPAGPPLPRPVFFMEWGGVHPCYLSRLTLWGC